MSQEEITFPFGSGVGFRWSWPNVVFSDCGSGWFLLAVGTLILLEAFIVVRHLCCVKLSGKLADVFQVLIVHLHAMDMAQEAHHTVGNFWHPQKL